MIPATRDPVNCTPLPHRQRPPWPAGATAQCRPVPLGRIREDLSFRIDNVLPNEQGAFPPSRRERAPPHAPLIFLQSFPVHRIPVPPEAIRGRMERTGGAGHPSHHQGLRAFLKATHTPRKRSWKALLGRRQRERNSQDVSAQCARPARKGRQVQRCRRAPQHRKDPCHETGRAKQHTGQAGPRTRHARSWRPSRNPLRR